VVALGLGEPPQRLLLLGRVLVFAHGFSPFLAPPMIPSARALSISFYRIGSRQCAYPTKVVNFALQAFSELRLETAISEVHGGPPRVALWYLL
jgi:hypothetical protein